MYTLTRASKDSIVRNLDSVIRLSKRLSDIQSLEVAINSASFDVCILWLIVSINKSFFLFESISHKLYLYLPPPEAMYE